jgi:hypothetical protein
MCAWIRLAVIEAMAPGSEVPVVPLMIKIGAAEAVAARLKQSSVATRKRFIANSLQSFRMRGGHAGCMQIQRHPLALIETA